MRSPRRTARHVKLQHPGEDDVFLARRAALLSEFAPTTSQDVRARLAQVSHAVEAPAPAEQLCSLIRDSLEDGLLRCSQRAKILSAGRKLGFSDFHTHLLIAQTQFGPQCVVSEDAELPSPPASGAAAGRLAAALLLALALLLAAIRWLGI
jgi:hypothetical protein